MKLQGINFISLLILAFTMNHLFFSCSYCFPLPPDPYAPCGSLAQTVLSLWSGLVAWTSCWVIITHSTFTLTIQSFVWHLLGTCYVPGLVDTGDTKMNKVQSCLSSSSLYRREDKSNKCKLLAMTLEGQEGPVHYQKIKHNSYQASRIHTESGGGSKIVLYLAPGYFIYQISYCSFNLS